MNGPADKREHLPLWHVWTCDSSHRPPRKLIHDVKPRIGPHCVLKDRPQLLGIAILDGNGL